MTRFALVAIASIFIAGCGTSTYRADTAADSGGIYWPDGDVAAYLLDIADEYDGFEADLGAWGAPDSTVVSETSTGIAQIVETGEDFSTRTGEERIALHGGHALVLQATTGAADGLATLTSEVFVPAADHLMFSQLSEVDSRGIELWIEVYSDADGWTLPTMYDIPVVTGGHQPGLGDGDDPVEEFSSIVEGEGADGRPVFQAIDISEFNLRGNEIRVRFIQRSTAAPYDFFTLVDDVSLLDIPAAYEGDLTIVEATRPY